MWCVLGHVGVPLACNHVKLEDVPDMNYFAVNGEGEVGGLLSVVTARHLWWGCLYQGQHTIVNRCGLDSFEILSKALAVLEPHFPTPHCGDYNRVLFTR